MRHLDGACVQVFMRRRAPPMWSTDIIPILIKLLKLDHKISSFMSEYFMKISLIINTMLAIIIFLNIDMISPTT